MKRNRILFDFLKFPVVDKISFGTNVVQLMRSNEAYDSLKVWIDELSTKTEILDVRYIATLDATKLTTAQLREADSEWKEVIRELAIRLELLAKDNTPLLVGAGFGLARQQSSSTRPLLRVLHTDKPGSVSVRRKADKEARAYVWQTNLTEDLDNESAWTTAAITSQASTILSGLTPMTKCWFRVAVVTREGTSAFSHPVMLIVI